MKIEEVNPKCQILKDVLSESPSNPFKEAAFWENLVSSVRDNTELEAFLRMLFRHLSGGNRYE